MFLVCSCSGQQRIIHAPKESLSARWSRHHIEMMAIDNAHQCHFEMPQNRTQHLAVSKLPMEIRSFQAAELCKKSKSIAKKLAATILSREEAFIACQAIITPSLSYPLATSWLSEKQLATIQSPYMGIIARQSASAKTQAEQYYLDHRHMEDTV